MLKPQIYQHFTCPKSNNSFGPYYKILPHCFRAQLSEIIILTKYNNLYENLHAKSNRCLCRRGKPDGIGLNWIFTKRCLFYFTYIFLWILTETSTTQQLTKMCVKQSHLLLIYKGWSFIKQNNLWLLLKMAKLFYQVKEENFSAKISNWEHSRYCEKIQTILFSMLHSQHWYRKFDLFYLWGICDPIALFTHFKTNTKSIGIYRVLRCCVLLKHPNIVSHENGLT